MKFKLLLGLMTTLILFTSLIAMFNMPAVVSAESWITVRGPGVEMSIENKTTLLVFGEELSILMVSKEERTFPSSQVFDVRLYDSNHSLFSYWSMDKFFLTVITHVPPGYNQTLRWNLYRYEGGKYFPPPTGLYYLVGVLVNAWEMPESVTPEIPLKIDYFSVTPVAEFIPTTEVFYGDGCQLFDQGIYIVATEINPVDVYPNYKVINDFYKMLKAHVTTRASTEDFVSILISRGRFPTSGYGIQVTSIYKYGYSLILSASFTNPSPGAILLQVLTNPLALIPIGKLPAGEYSITLYIDWCVGKDHVGTETWTVTFTVTVVGDVNCDRKVDASDLFDLSKTYGSTPPMPNWNPNCDFNRDNKIEGPDLFALSKNYGKTEP